MNNTRFWVGLSVILITVLTNVAATGASSHWQSNISCNDVYVVQSTDWLSKVAEKFLGDVEAYQAIVNATNQQHQIDPSFAIITNPNVIEVGWKLCIPAAPDAETIVIELSAVETSEIEALSPPNTVPPVYTLENFVREFNFGPDVRSEWIYSTPPDLSRYQITPEQQRIDDTFGYRANYYWNENLSDDYFLYSGIFDAVPPAVKVFDAPWDSVLPRYRYPPNITLPTGLTTNQFGWRGPPIALIRHPNTIRIAAVGASTTVGGHTLPFSYPEFLQHWLNTWAESSGYDVDFEVINTGREGLNSNDIVKVVQYEVLPLDVDYVIYYEGSNQFHPETVVSFPAEYKMGQPPPGIIPNLANVDSEDKNLLDLLSEYSALAARARNIVEQFLVTGQEPPKPEQNFILPEGLDEFNPNRQNQDDTLDLRRIQNDLDQIKQDLDANNVTMIMTTFNWFVQDGMVLDPTRHRNLYTYLNRVFWPISYANMRRAADFQNRVFTQWAANNRVPLFDITAQMPVQPDLYDDAIHNTYLGSRIRAWIVFEELVPLLKEDIENGRLPRPSRVNYTQHPYITDKVKVRQLSEDSGTN
jgi:hypothetical protein